MNSIKPPLFTIAALAVAVSVVTAAAGAGIATPTQPSIASSVGTPQSAALTRAEYLQQARKICFAANRKVRKLPGGMFGYAPSLSPRTNTAWATKIARLAQQVLAKLHALPPPPANRIRVKRWFSLADRYPPLFRRMADAASADELTRFAKLSHRRIELTHREDRVGYFPWSCPLTLPA
jgi:hypothetical protein